MERVKQIRKELAMANRVAVFPFTSKEREFFCCFVCSRVFMNEEAMRQHVTEKHLAFKKEYKLKCPLCYRRFVKKQKLDRHLRTHEDRSFLCKICNTEFREEVSLRVHMSRVHSLSLEGAKITKEHGCNCGKKYGTVEELKRHRYYCDSRESILEKRRKARQEFDAMSMASSQGSPPQSVISSCSDSTSGISIGSASGRPIKDKSCPYCFLVCASMQSRRRHIERKHPENLGAEEVDSHNYIKVQSVCSICDLV
ncbi:unnamed protein product [Strongylus vulgaris]|uniref:C2H2-type domain-containing protein n=1 Tax=Strongylus vulgaris TaxID=40348 RepID=A0A3P7IX13_STRVU|nr:unnamed protein product [Strongylus vulgaris]